jgi:hypothetical protein
VGAPPPLTLVGFRPAVARIGRARERCGGKVAEGGFPRGNPRFFQFSYQSHNCCIFVCCTSSVGDALNKVGNLVPLYLECMRCANRYMLVRRQLRVRTKRVVYLLDGDLLSTKYTNNRTHSD